MEQILEFLRSPAGEFVGLAIIVGGIVSIDVCGLILSQFRGFQAPDPGRGEGMFRRMPFRQAMIHASWHAILFFVYMLAIYLLIPFFFELIALTAFLCNLLINGLRYVLSHFGLSILIPLLEVDVHNLEQTFRLVFSAGVIGFVWLTYSDKINENHKEKAQNADALIDDLRVDLRVFFTAFRRLVGGRTLMTNALAATVAVDMLAISALTKNTFIPTTIDTAKAAEVSTEAARAVYLTPFVALDLLIFSLIIFGCVLILAWWVGGRSKRIAEAASHKWNLWLFGLRVAEPFLVFFFVAYALEPNRKLR